MSKLHPHVAQSPETHHANFLAFGDAPVTQWRVCCDSGTEQRRGSGQVEVGGNSQNKAFIDHDALGVAAVGDAAEVLVWGIVGEGQIRTELLQAGPALAAGTIRIDHAADRGEIARLELSD